MLVIPFSLMGQTSETTLSKCPYAHMQTTEKSPAGEYILCPFLDIAQPDTSSYKSFAQSCSEAGMEYKMAKFVAKSVGKKQRGKTAVREGKTPDPYRLDEVKGISHSDLYQKHLKDMLIWMGNMEVDGKITLQDLVAIKKRIAELEGVEVSKASKIETALAFIAAGGDLENWTVKSSDIQLFLSHELPGSPIEVTIKKLRKTRRKARWK